jgi:hypothetical protein
MVRRLSQVAAVAHIGAAILVFVDEDKTATTGNTLEDY